MGVAKCILLPCYFAFCFQGIFLGVLIVPISGFVHLQCSSPICSTAVLWNKTGPSIVTVSSSSGLHIGVYTGFSGISRGRLCRCILTYTHAQPICTHMLDVMWGVYQSMVLSYVHAPVLLWWMSHFLCCWCALVLTGLQHPWWYAEAGWSGEAQD